MTIAPTIGAELYYIINTALRFEFLVPFRISMPEKDLSRCEKSGDVCSQSDKSMYASFSVQLYVELYFYSYIDTKIFESIIKALVLKEDPRKEEELPFRKGARVGGAKLMGKKYIGCSNLKESLEPLNDYYRAICCGDKNIFGDQQLSLPNLNVKKKYAALKGLWVAGKKKLSKSSKEKKEAKETKENKENKEKKEKETKEKKKEDKK